MAELRDYQEWHRAYDDPDSGLSWRLATVQGYLREALDRQAAPARVLSLCSGDGRDVLDVLSGRADADRVAGTLVELHPDIAQQARDRAAAAGLGHVAVLTADAGSSDVLVGAVPADIVLLVGIFGNISTADLERTIAASPQLCAPGATLIWSRGRRRNDLNDLVRRRFAEAGFSELHYATREGGRRPGLGLLRYDGEPQRLLPGQQWFTFLR